MFKKIYIRADGSPEIGLGHLVRCLALAKMLKDDFLIHFVSKQIPGTLKKELKKNDFFLSTITSEEDFFSLLSGDEIVVLDHYGLDSDYQKKIKNIGCKLVCIDDLQEQEYFADLIINHSPGILPEDYQAQEYTRYALGPKYALLRPVFLEAAGLEKKIEEVKNVMVCFGGSDFKNLTASVVQVVQRIEKIGKITVILGAAYLYRESIDAIADSDVRIKVLSNLDEQSMFREIKEADLAIIPSSGILYEVIACGCIPLICYYAENQRKFFNYFRKNKLLLSFNAMEFNDEELNAVISDFLNKKIKIKEIPLRKKIKESSSNNLNNFKQLING